MKLLLLGAGGQIGFELQRALAPLGDLVCATRTGQLPGGAECAVADLARADALIGLLDDEAPDLVINAAAYTAVDRAESEEAVADAVNAEAPGVLARWCAQRDAALVHFSTDYVFDGRGTRAYREDDATAPLGAYGRGKLAGEAVIRVSGARHLILRTAWVYAARGQNFLRTMLRVAKERDSLRVVADQRGAPTPARWIAAATALLVARSLRDGFDRLTTNGLEQRRPSTTFHLTASGETTWHGFAQAIFEDALAAGLIERVPRVEPIATAAYPTPAQRPAYSRLDNTRLYDAFGLRLPDWRRGVSDVIAELS
jgi:dTDP-4-dehydrorhamnose reductase